MSRVFHALISRASTPAGDNVGSISISVHLGFKIPHVITLTYAVAFFEKNWKVAI